MRWTTDAGPSSSSQDKPIIYTSSPQQKLLDTLTWLTDVTSILVHARGNLLPRDYLAIGMKGVQSVLRIRELWSKKADPNLETLFTSSGSGWRQCPRVACSYAFKDREIRETPIEGHQIFRKGRLAYAAWTAEVDGVEIGWVSSPDTCSIPRPIYSKTPEKIKYIAARRMWESASTSKSIRLERSAVSPCIIPSVITETVSLQNIEQRLRRFLAAGASRSVLLDGEPGTGKSTSAVILAHRLGLSSVTVSAVDLVSPQGIRRFGEWSYGAVIEILRPGVLIINDLDRLDIADQPKLLSTMDHAQDYTQFVFVTTNRYRDLAEPLRRPGRLDDYVHVPGLSREEIIEAAPAFRDYASRMQGWPIAYIADLQSRYEALGDLAFDEVAEVERRLAEVRQDGGYAKSRAVETIGKENYDESEKTQNV